MFVTDARVLSAAHTGGTASTLSLRRH